VAFINGQLARVQTRASTLQDKYQIQLTYLRLVTTFLVQATMELELSLKTTIGSLMIPSQKPEELRWQWRPQPIQLLFLSEQLESEIGDGTYQELSRSQDLTLTDSSSDSSEKDEATSRRSHDSETIQTELLESLVRNIAKGNKPKPEAPKPKTYWGDPEDLKRFIRSLKNVWAIEKHKYKDDLTKIRYAANLLNRPMNNKYRDPVPWYESYHPKINLAAARRLPGRQKVALDPSWQTWSIFVEALYSFFGTKVGKEQAITEWLILQHSTSIDDYLDTLINLVWRTRYLEEVAEDKLVHGLNQEVRLAWA